MNSECKVPKANCVCTDAHTGPVTLFNSPCVSYSSTWKNTSMTSCGHPVHVTVSRSVAETNDGKHN